MEDATTFLCQHPRTEKPHRIFFEAGLPDLKSGPRQKLRGSHQQALTRLNDTIFLAAKEISAKYSAKLRFAVVSPSEGKNLQPPPPSD